MSALIRFHNPLEKDQSDPTRTYPRPNHISKMVRPTVHFGPLWRTQTVWAAHRLPSHISKTVRPIVKISPREEDRTSRQDRRAGFTKPPTTSRR